MRVNPGVLFLIFATGSALTAWGQGTPMAANGTAEATADKTVVKLTVPSGTQVPVIMKHAVSTKSAKVGDPIYAETSFPVVIGERVVIPAGTYVQGKIAQVQRAGRVKGRAEVLIHFTTMIYPNGYTVMLPGAIENVPGAETTHMKGDEGAVQEQGQKGKDIGTIASTAGTGALIGAVASGAKGAGIGAGAGAAVGLMTALLTRGNDVRLEAGTTLQMVIQRDLQLDPTRVTARQSVVVQ